MRDAKKKSEDFLKKLLMNQLEITDVSLFANFVDISQGSDL